MSFPRRKAIPRIWASAAALALGATLLAQGSTPPLAQLESDLAEARSRLAASGPRESARLELVKRCDEIERALITAGMADDRLATWLADRAAWSLELAGEDGADAAVLYGLPTLAQQHAVHGRAQDALDLLSRADQAATHSVERLETELVKLGTSDQAKARAAEIEATLAALADGEQADRIPRLRTMARLLLGASGRDPADRESVQAAAKELSARSPGVDALDDVRAVALGTALVHSAGASADRADEIYDAAAIQLRPVAKKYAPGSDAQAATALRARLALLRAGRETPSRPRSEDAARERAIDLMEAEAKSAALFDRASREQGARTLLLGSAIRTLVDAAKTAGADEAVRLRMYDKLAGALPPGAPLDRLPPEATLARAVARVREAGMKDPLAREDASAMLAALAERTDASPELRSQARWERAVIAGASQNPLAELDAVAAVVAADAESEKGPIAARRVFDLFARQQGTAGAAALDDKWNSRLPALRTALALLVRRDTAESARWNSELIRLSMAELSTAEGARGSEAGDRALSLLVTGAGSPAEKAALSESLLRNMDHRSMALAGRSSPAAKDWEALLPQARRASVWALSGDPTRAPDYMLLLGEALVGSESAEAASVLTGLAGSSIDQPGSPLFARFRLSLGRAQLRAGDNARALSTYRELADRLEGAPGSASPEPAYWAAWSEMLAIMQAENKDGARSGDIRVQIKRLELVDPKLGGSPYAERIRQIRAAIGE
jgi:hypothetical protein